MARGGGKKKKKQGTAAAADDEESKVKLVTWQAQVFTLLYFTCFLSS